MGGNLLNETLFDTTPPIAEVSTARQFVTFTCGARALGVDIMSVREIRSWSPVTQLPGQPFGSLGILDIRGQIVEVYDLASMIGAHVDETQSSRVVLVVSREKCDVGIVVDSVSDIIFAQEEDLRPVPTSGSGSGNAAVSALVKSQDKLIAVLNLSALFPEDTYN